MSGIPFCEGCYEKTSFDLSAKTFTEVRGIIRQYLKEILNDSSRACKSVNAAINVDKNRITMNTGFSNSENPEIYISSYDYYNDTIHLESERIINYSILIYSQVTDLIQFDEQENKDTKFHFHYSCDEETDDLKLICVSLYKEDEELIERNRVMKMWMNSNKQDQ